MFVTKLLVKIGRPLGVRALTRWVRDVAEGDHGDGLQKAYWKLTGWKTGVGFILATLAIVAGLTDADPRITWTITAVGSFLVSVGLTDKAWRDQRPAWTEAMWFRLLASAPVEVSGAFTAAFVWTATRCTYGEVWCGLIEACVLFLAGAAIQLGLLDSAWRAPGPQVSLARVRQLTGRVVP